MFLCTLSSSWRSGRCFQDLRHMSLNEPCKRRRPSGFRRRHAGVGHPNSCVTRRSALLHLVLVFRFLHVTSLSSGNADVVPALIWTLSPTAFHSLTAVVEVSGLGVTFCDSMWIPLLFKAVIRVGPLGHHCKSLFQRLQHPQLEPFRSCPRAFPRP